MPWAQPVYDINVAAESNAAFGVITITASTGVVNAVGSNSSFSISGISFRTDA